VSARCIISVDECPNHGTKVLSIGDGSTSVRFSGPKCCGRWNTVEEFEMCQESLRELMIECDSEIARLELAEED